jgi:hypothetical protein
LDLILLTAVDFSAEATGEDTVQEDDSDAELKDRRAKTAVQQPAESDTHNQSEVQIIEAQVFDQFQKCIAVTKARQDKREASKTTGATGSKPVRRDAIKFYIDSLTLSCLQEQIVDEAEYSIDARILKV